MRFSLVFCAGLLSTAAASTLPTSSRSSRSSRDLTPRTSCENTATSRDCWGDYDISTDWYEEIFHTGVTREYWLDVVNMTLAPDGFARQTLSFNGTIPGPAITADWGDDLVIHVTNKLENNGTSVHWHGMRQLGSSEYDGVPGVTQCPITPGETMTYRLHASQYGSSWYHSHFSLQYGDGLVGPLIIDGPTTADYDEDLGTLMLSDWDHRTVFQNWDATRAGGFGPEMNNVLLNYQGTYNCTGAIDEGTGCVDSGTRLEYEFVSGTKYKIRLINTAVDGWFTFSIDNHTFEVVATDFVPVVPFTASKIQLTVGQRYDIIVTADALAGNFWMRSGWQEYCATNYAYDNGVVNGGNGIIRYKSVNGTTTAGDPTTPAPAVVASCADANHTLFVPYVAKSVGPASSQTELDMNYALVDGFNTWSLGNSTLWLNWSDPTTLKAYKNESIFPTDYNVVPLTVVNDWVYWVLIDDTGFEVVHHPIHLHGHDFYVLAQESLSTFTNETVLNLDNPMRRDTASLPGGGYLVIAFKTDNPGSWLMHCHIAWHVAEGFAMQFVERENEIAASLVEPELFLDTCKVWDDWYPTSFWMQEDAGV